MNKDEEIISNISYTNSDFRTIFPQLLDTAKKLTNKWDPSLSNESDPGNILIKENAIVADKNNYHIDKSILEAFPLSVTQQGSARQLYSLAGYTMHWYRSAISKVSFTLKNSLETINNSTGTTSDTTESSIEDIVIPAGTQVMDSSGEYIYTTLENSGQLSKIGDITSVDAIQGTISKYEINGNNTITVDNLDENLRIYFPYSTIAENGIFVYNTASKNPIAYRNDGSGESWKIVENLTTQPAGSKVFQFGVNLADDNCYIQFPEDIASSTLIAEGLNIFYVNTNGANGSISKQLLDTFNGDVTQNGVVLNSFIGLTNDASTQGKNPEDLNSAYKNYKKTIGTFNTLVSRRDYEAAIYNLTQSDSTRDLVSNAMVADRTTDINCSNKVVNWGLSGNFTKNYVKQDNNVPLIKPYDIILYLYKAPVSMSTVSDYDESFTPELQDSVKYDIDGQLEDTKSVQHDLYYISDIDAKSNKPYFGICNKCKLTGKLTTFYKVTKEDAKDIKTNVITALINKYNAREIDLGTEIGYDEIVETIKSADDRIRNVSLDIPTYVPTMQYALSSNEEINLYTGKDNLTESIDQTTQDIINNETLAKMILAGKISLFEFEDDFQLDFGQTDAHVYKNIQKITTANKIKISKSKDEPTKLVPNDVLQIITPTLVTTDSFGGGVRFALKLNDKSEIFNDQPYALKENEKVKFIYSNNGTNESKLYTEGTILVFSTGSNYNSSNNSEYTGDQWKDTASAKYNLKVNQTISVQNVSQINIPTNTPYYIISNNVENGYYTIKLTADTERVLTTGEYLIYPNSTATGLIILESGTSLKCTDDITLVSKIIDYDKILSTTVTDQAEWNKITNTITAIENNIVTLTENDTIYGDIELEANSDTFKDYKNEKGYQSLTYIINGESTTISVPENLTNYYIKVKSDLLLNSNQLVPQTLTTNQSITLYPGVTITQSWSILFNYPVNRLGGTDIDMQVLDVNTQEYAYLLSALVYKQGSLVKDVDINRENGVLTLPNKSSKYTLNYTFDAEDYYYILPISIVLGANETVELSGPQMSITPIRNNETTIVLDASGEYNIFIHGKNITSNATAIPLVVTFSANNYDKPSSFVSFKYFKKVVGLNTKEINVLESVDGTTFTYNLEDKKDNVLTILNGLPGSETYDWTYVPVSGQKVVQPLLAESYFNKDHVYNKNTIAKIDIRNSNIEVDASNILK